MMVKLGWHTIPSPCKLRDSSGLRGLKCLEDSWRHMYISWTVPWTVPWTVLACHPIKSAPNNAKNNARQLLWTKHVAWFPLFEHAISFKPWISVLRISWRTANCAASCAAAEQALPVQPSFASPGLGIPVNERKTARRLQTKTRGTPGTQRTSKNTKELKAKNKDYILNNDGRNWSSHSFLKSSLKVIFCTQQLSLLGTEATKGTSEVPSEVPPCHRACHFGFTLGSPGPIETAPWASGIIWAFAHPGRSQAPELKPCPRATCKLLSWKTCEDFPIWLWRDSRPGVMDW